MRYLTLLILISLTAISFSSCSILFNSSTFEIPILSNPSRADVVIKGQNGVVVMEGRTPFFASVKSTRKTFSREVYSIEYSKEGYRTSTEMISFKLSPFFLVDFILFQIPGFLISGITNHHLIPAEEVEYGLLKPYINKQEVN